MQRIKQGDTVQVISGNEIGARGEVKTVLRDWQVDRNKKRTERNRSGDRVVVGGINIRKKHQRPISQTRTQTGIIEREAPLHISNVMLVCPKCGEITRVNVQRDEEGAHRVCKKCQAMID